VLGDSFPSNPPKGFFLTKIFHPNVAKNGAICVNTLKKDWKPTYGIEHVLTVIKCLLIHPNPASALNEDAGKLLLEHYEDFASRARMMTDIHARPKDGSGAGEAIQASSSAKHGIAGSTPIAKKMKDKSGEGKKALKAQNKKKALKRL
jgi:ubiquitin-conjugating enzyme E2 S